MSDAAPVEREPGRGRGVRAWLAMGLVAIMLASAAFLAGRFTASPPEATPTQSSADAGFARDMQVHHGQAVEMAMIIYPVTTDPEVRAISYDIATGQSGQRGQMYQWLVDWGLPQAGGVPMQWMEGEHGHGGSAAPADADEAYDAMGMATDAELEALRAATGTAADCQFLSLMIRHHEGAIGMVEAVLDLGEVPFVRATASSMAETQGAEIDAMLSAQSRLGCAAG